MTSEVGPYRLESLVGAGGMGEVWRAVDTEHDDRPVAVKVLPPGVAEGGEFAERFRREARLAAGLRHPHVIPIHRYGESDGRLYLAMQLVDGDDLSAVLAREGPLAPDRAVAVVAQVADVLDAAHAQGLLHRDVKPSNVRLVGPRDFVYLMDFGIARPVTDGGLTGTGHLVGTAAYMAPERFSPGPVDHRADVYSLAALLHSCLTGALPFAGTDLARAAWAHTHEPVPRPSDHGGDHLAPFDAVVARGMAKDPDDRPASAGELAAAATLAVEDRRPIAPRPGGHPERSAPDDPTVPPGPPLPSATLLDPGRSRPGRRGTRAAVGLVGVAVLAVVAVLVTLALARPESTVAAPPPGASSSRAAPAGAPAAAAALPVGSVVPVALAADPSVVAASPDGRFVYAGSDREDALEVVDATTNRVVATVPLDDRATSLAASPDGTTLWALTGDGVQAVATATNTVTGSVPLDGQPSGLAVSPDGRRLLVGRALEGAVTEVDAATLAPGRSLPAVPLAEGVAVGPDGTIAVTSRSDPAMALIGAAGTRTVPTPRSGLRPRFAPDGRVVLTDDRGEVPVVVDVASGAVGAAPTGAVTSVAFGPDGRSAYAFTAGDGEPAAAGGSGAATAATAAK